MENTKRSARPIYPDDPLRTVAEKLVDYCSEPYEDRANSFEYVLAPVGNTDLVRLHGSLVLSFAMAPAGVPNRFAEPMGCVSAELIIRFRNLTGDSGPF